MLFGGLLPTVEGCSGFFFFFAPPPPPPSFPSICSHCDVQHSHFILSCLCYAVSIGLQRAVLTIAALQT